MTNAEAIEFIKRKIQIDVSVLTSDEVQMTTDVLNMAIAALEKQEGKKPTHEASIYKCFTCPTCKNVIDHFEEFVPGQKAKILYKHCHFCGQRIDWSNEHGAD